MAETFQVLRGRNLKTAAVPKNWVWDGLIGPGQLTLFTSVCKIGKTTLLAHLLAARKLGNAFLERDVKAGASAIVSEEAAELWDERHALLGFRDDDCFICRPFALPPSPERWQSLIDQIAALHQSDGLDLAVIDPLAHFLPAGAESDRDLLLQSLLPLRRLTDAGLAVVLVHHPRKAAAQPGLASRGSSLLPAFADIIMEMYPASQNAPRQRRLLAFSRHPDTPRRLYFELDEDGRAFRLCPEPPLQDEFAETWKVLRLVLDDATGELTRQEILEQWPNTYLAPKEVTLWKWLNKALEQGLVRVEGNGRRADPFRYYLPEKQEAWKEDPFYNLIRTSRENSLKATRDLSRPGLP